MFLRFFLALAGLGVASCALVGHLILLRGGAGVAAADALTVVLVAAVLAVGPAWLLARSVTRSHRQIRSGAERVAAGDFGRRVDGGVWRVGRDLARAFNEMSERVAGRIDRLEAERQQLRATLGGLVEGVVAVGPGQRVLFANEAAGHILDCDPATAVGRPLYEVSRQPEIQAVVERARKTGQPHQEGIELQTLTLRHLAVYVAPIRAGDASGAVLVLNDTSELRRLERLRQDFVANVSHELKTPLAVVKACAETLLDGAVEDPVARRPFLQQIAEQSERLHALILDLLSLARIESRDEVMEFAAVTVRDAVVRCLDRHKLRADAKQQTLEAGTVANDLMVWADEEALGHILDNLVDNAVKYTQSGGTIRVHAASEAGGVAIRITDNGPGIPERDLPRVFERFYRVDRARSRELGGTGLGLAIVKHLVHALAGSVEATSELGKGTTFLVRLPTTEIKSSNY